MTEIEALREQVQSLVSKVIILEALVTNQAKWLEELQADRKKRKAQIKQNTQDIGLLATDIMRMRNTQS